MLKCCEKKPLLSVMLLEHTSGLCCCLLGDSRDRQKPQMVSLKSKYCFGYD